MAFKMRLTLLAMLTLLVVRSSSGWCDEPAPSSDKPAAKKPAKTPAKPQRVVQLADGSVTLAARDVTVHGSTVRYEREKDTIGYWTKLDDNVSWDLAITQPGRFEVIAYQSCGQGNAGSEYSVEIGDQKLTGRVQDTASFRIFSPRAVGVVELTAPGRYTLTIRPLSKPGLAVMDLRWVKLQPIRPKKKEALAAPTPENPAGHAPPDDAAQPATPSPKASLPGKADAGK
jgi:hypothetical protein